MKGARKIILLFKDSGSGGECFADTLQPNPSQNLRRVEDSFELSLEKYGIKDKKASGSIFHFVNDNGVYEVSVFIVNNYAPPVLACALNEVLAVFYGGNPSNLPTLVVPFLVEVSQLKVENKNLNAINGTYLYGLQLGPVNNSTQALAAKVQKPPDLQINHEQLACLFHFVRALDIPAFLLVGQFARHNSSNGLQVIHEMGDHLANFSSLSFLKERIGWSPSKSSSTREEPWRALYG